MSYPIMSNFPISMAKGLHKSMVFESIVSKTAAHCGQSGVSFTPYPTYEFEFDLDSVQGNEALLSSITETFRGIFALTQGRAGLFLFVDPQDNAVSYIDSGMLGFTTGGTITAGDGATVAFQLARSIGGVAWDIIQFASITGLKVNGTLKYAPGDYSVNSTGLVTFTSAPGNNAVLTWVGTFMFGGCRFDADSYDATRKFTKNSGTDIWDIQSIKFTTEFV